MMQTLEGSDPSSPEYGNLTDSQDSNTCSMRRRHEQQYQQNSIHSSPQRRGSSWISQMQHTMPMTSPFRSPSSVTPSKKSVLGEKIMHSLTKKANAMKCNITSDMPTEELEDLNCVYDNVEALLEVVRAERHQEKLEAEEEIRQLKERLAVYENTTNCSDKYLEDAFFSTTGTADINSQSHYQEELAECLRETMALLEEECLEWQSSMSCKRLSLDNITNLGENTLLMMSTPPPQKPIRRKSSSKQTPRQKELVKSLQRLKQVSQRIQMQQQEPRLLMDDLDYSDHSNGDGAPLVAKKDRSVSLFGLDLLEDDVVLQAKENKEQNNMATQTDHKFPDEQSKEIGALEKEIQSLRQQLWEQMVLLKNQRKQWENEVTEQTCQKLKLVEKLQATEHEQFQVYQRVLESKISSDSQDLEVVSPKVNTCTEAHCKQRIEELQKKLNEFQKSVETKLTGKDVDVDKIHEELAIFKKNQETLHLQCLHLQMQLGQEQHAKCLAQTQLKISNDTCEQLKLEAALTKQQLSSVQSQMYYLSDDLSRARLEARECVEAIHATVAHPGFGGDEHRMF